MTQIIIKNIVAIDERNDNAPGSVLITFNHDTYFDLKSAQERVEQYGYLAIDIPVNCHLIWHSLNMEVDEHDGVASIEEHQEAFAAFNDEESRQTFETVSERFHVTEDGITLIAECKDGNATSAFETSEISFLELRSAILLSEDN
ncbi:hypothetical protein AB6D11_18500 [Vibrio splendidus]